MKFSILIFVLTTVIYECHCSPTTEIDSLRQAWDERFKGLNKRIQDMANYFNDDLKSGSRNATYSQIIDGNRIDNFKEEEVINNVKYQTITSYNHGTKERIINKYKCSLPPNSHCVLRMTEIKDNPLINKFQQEVDDSLIALNRKIDGLYSKRDRIDALLGTPVKQSDKIKDGPPEN